MLAEPATAADLARPAPVYIPPPPIVVAVFSWTGWYIGVNAGGHWSRDNDSPTISQAVNGVNGGYFTPVDLAATTAGLQNTLTPSGFAGGVHAGYNWQMSSIVLGFEADIMGLSGSANRVGVVPLNGGAKAATLNDTAKDRWLATIRGRAGFAIDRALIYATGGVAFSSWNLSHSYTDNVAAVPAAFGANSSTTTRVGWIVGAGLEYALTNNWTLRGEYLYAAFGTSTSAFLMTNGNTCGGGVTCNATFNYSEKLSESIARVGLTYKFF